MQCLRLAAWSFKTWSFKKLFSLASAGTHGGVDAIQTSINFLIQSLPASGTLESCIPHRGPGYGPMIFSTALWNPRSWVCTEVLVSLGEVKLGSGDFPKLPKGQLNPVKSAQNET